MRARTGLAFACLSLLAPAAAPAAETALRAGGASADITPPIGTPMFAYTARSRVFGPENNADLLDVLADPDHGLHAKSFVGSTGIHTRLKARALVLERAGVPYAMVQADIGGLPHALVQAVAEKVAATGITEERLLISATHTHSAHGAIWPTEDNSAYAVVGGDLFDHRAWNATVGGLSEAILKAHRRLRQARVGIATIALLGASRNRASGSFARNENKPELPIDPDLTVVRVDAAQGKAKPIAVWSNFAIHATSLDDSNRLLSGDNPGYTAEIVERRIGKGVVNVWTNGNEGDISPHGDPAPLGGEPGEHVTSEFAKAHLAGARVAEGVVDAFELAGEEMLSDVALAARQAYLPFDGTTADGERVGPIPGLGAGGIDPSGVLPQGAPVEGMAGPGQGFKFPLFGAPKIIPDVAPVSIWRIGELGVVALPSEVTRTAGMRIRAAVLQAAGGAIATTAIAGLTDGYLSYTATHEEFDNCEYEGSMTLFGRRQAARYRDFAAGLAGNLFTGATAPVGAPVPARTGTEQGLAPEPQATTGAGEVLAQPADSVARLGRATFSWRGGDRTVEAPRGQTFVRLQRRRAGKWRTVATDATFHDTVRRDAGNVYVETYHFGHCDPLGDYRFLVTGRAYNGSAITTYRTESETFELEPLVLEADAPTTADGVTTVRARYPSPGAEALIYAPRIVTTGSAEFRSGDEVESVAPTQDGFFRITSDAPPALVGVVDGCGNATA